MSQQQDLVFFNDNSLISSRLFSTGLSTLHIISHSQATTPAWLVSSMIENALVGTAPTVNRDLTIKTPNRALVAYVLFTHSEDFVAKNCRKQGVDLSALSNYAFVDCFSDLFTKRLPNGSREEAEKLFESVAKTIEAQTCAHKVVILEHPEILLAATELQSNDLLFLIQRIKCNALFVVIDTESSLVNLSNTNPQDPVFKITDFFVKLHHKSSMNINLQPLPTGRAKDITGCLTIAHGAIPPNSDVQVVEREYIYHVTKEANVKLYFR